jgi:phosphoserine phosphatase
MALKIAPPPLGKVILIRHGQSNYNAEKRYQGSSDDSWLTELGQHQADQARQILQHSAIDAVYISPLKRTQQTAEQLLQGFGQIPLTIDPNLREIDLPDWEGLPFAQVKSQFAADYQHWINAPQSFQLSPSCFPVRDLYQRAQRFWQTVLPQQRGKTILIVSHSGTIRALTSTALGIPIEQFHYLQQSNTGVTTLVFDSLGKATLQGMNQTHHLGEVLPKPKHGKQGIRLILLASDNLPKADVDYFTRLFQSISINFSLNTPGAASRSAQAILKQHPQAVSFEVTQPNFLLKWQELILTQRDRLLAHDPKTPTNALVIAPSKTLQTFIARILHLPETDAITICPNHYTTVFYPAQFQHPVLQSLNTARLDTPKLDTPKLDTTSQALSSCLTTVAC